MLFAMVMVQYSSFGRCQWFALCHLLLLLLLAAGQNLKN